MNHDLELASRHFIQIKIMVVNREPLTLLEIDCRGHLHIQFRISHCGLDCSLLSKWKRVSA